MRRVVDGRRFAPARIRRSVCRVDDDVGVDVAEAGLAAGGILSGEHGLGRVKRPFVKRAYDPNTLETMRRIKKAFDPDGLMNPGAMWPD